MKKPRKQHTAAFKAQVAHAAVKGERTINELASQYGVHPTMTHGWKKQLLDNVEELFARGGVPNSTNDAAAQREKAELYEQIGRLKTDMEWLKKRRPLRLALDMR